MRMYVYVCDGAFLDLGWDVREAQCYKGSSVEEQCGLPAISTYVHGQRWTGWRGASAPVGGRSGKNRRHQVEKRLSLHVFSHAEWV